MSKVCRMGWQAGDPEKSQCHSSSPKSVCWQTFSPPKERDSLGEMTIFKGHRCNKDVLSYNVRAISPQSCCLTPYNSLAVGVHYNPYYTITG